MNDDLVRLAKALHFAALKHQDQRRKGLQNEPYVNHLAEVTQLLAEATEGADPVLLLGALLHDTVEDTDATIDELKEKFGAQVASLVAEVTDDKSLPKKTRKRLQIETVSKKSERARLLKIADKTSNLRSLVESPPDGWDELRKREYLVWARDVVAGCRGLNADLDAGFDAVCRQARKAFGLEEDAVQ